MVTIRAEKWVHEGNCIAHLDGEVYFIKGAIPGELVKIEIIKDTSKYKLARVIEVLEPSKERLPSDCSIYPRCGGCSFRHISYEREREIKLERLLEDGTRNHIPYERNSIPFHFGKETGYRNNFQLKTLDNKIGYFAEHSNHFLELPKSGCKNFHPELNEIIKNPKKMQDSKKWRILDSIYPYDKKKGSFTYKGIKITIPREGFFQVNHELLPLWLDEILTSIDRPSQILEVFSGSGLLSLFAAQKTNSLIGMEIDEKAVESAGKNAQENKITNVKFLAKNLYTQSIGEIKPDFLLANPPRNGLGKLIINWIRESKPSQISYSSCNYQTLNRDLKEILLSGYTIKTVSIFDFFPRTPYFETLVQLESN